MNKKDLSAFRRQFKSDSHSLKISMLYTAYVKKDNKYILHAEQAPFDMKGEAEQEIYLAGFKKLLTGGINTKLFELSFDDSAPRKRGPGPVPSAPRRDAGSLYGVLQRLRRKTRHPI